MGSLEGRVALITGASRGIGKGIALAMAKAGADVAVNYVRNEQAGRQTVKEVEALGRKAILVQADASKQEQVKELVDRTAQTFGKLDIVVANGGNLITGSFFDDNAVDVFHSLMYTHVFGYFYTAKLAEPYLRQNKRSDIIFISSLAAQQFWADEWAYATAKNAINALCKCIAKDANKYGMRVNCIGPSVVDTDMARKGFEGIIDIDAPETLKHVPYGRFIQPYDIGNLCVFLASEESFLINGQVIYVDWGVGPGSIMSYIPTKGKRG
ncbi:MAG: SDR family oxidoreductase [Dehalococcoidia bacterium]